MKDAYKSEEIFRDGQPLQRTRTVGAIVVVGIIIVVALLVHATLPPDFWQHLLKL